MDESYTQAPPRVEPARASAPGVTGGPATFAGGPLFDVDLARPKRVFAGGARAQVRVSARTGEGLKAWKAWLKERRASVARARAEEPRGHEHGR
jgi:hypothetical protein